MNRSKQTRQINYIITYHIASPLGHHLIRPTLTSEMLTSGEKSHPRKMKHWLPREIESDGVILRSVS